MSTDYEELKVEISALFDMHLAGELSEWESTFIDGIQRRFDAGHSLSSLQVAKVEELYDKYFPT